MIVSIDLGDADDAPEYAEPVMRAVPGGISRRAAIRAVARALRAEPVTDRSLTGHPASEATSGPTIVKAPFSRAELAALDVARGRTGRSDWARAQVLAAVRSGRAILGARPAGPGAAFVNFRVSGPDLAALDAARGAVSRSAYIRGVLLSAVA